MQLEGAGVWPAAATGPGPCLGGRNRADRGQTPCEPSPAPQNSLALTTGRDQRDARPGPLAPSPSSCRAGPRLVSCSRRAGLVGLSRFRCSLVHAALPGPVDTAAQRPRPLCGAAGPVWGDPVWSHRHAGPGGGSGGRALVLPASRRPRSGSSSGDRPTSTPRRRTPSGPSSGPHLTAFCCWPAPSPQRTRPLLPAKCNPAACRGPAAPLPVAPRLDREPPPVCWFLAGGPVV